MSYSNDKSEMWIENNLLFWLTRWFYVAKKGLLESLCCENVTSECYLYVLWSLEDDYWMTIETIGFVMHD